MQRQFLLRPEPKVNGAFLYCLAYAAEKTGLEVHAYVALSNHHHLVATDPHGRIAEFLQCFHLLLARSTNALRGRFGSVFDCAQTSCVRAVEAEDVLRQLVYTYCNPVSSGLVPRASEWPGARSTPSQLGETVSAEKPNWFFSGEMPDVVPLRIVAPACFPNWSIEELRQEVERATREREEECRAEVEESGTGFLGAPRALSQKPTDSAQSYERRWKLSPSIGAKRPGVRIEELRALVRFRKRYREALVEYRNAAEAVIFPAGTYLMRVFHLQRCEPLFSGAAVPAAP